MFKKINLLLLTICMFSTYSSKAQENKYNFSKIALENSRHPIRPGKPGSAPFWNKYSWRFIYAPAFDYNAVNKAGTYRYEILSLYDSSTYHFQSDVPYAPLSPVWAKIPVGRFKLKVIGISGQGDSLGLAGAGQYCRASPFNPPNGQIYNTAVLPYDSSAKLALQRLMHYDYVSYWLTHNSPDPEFKLYRYPSKIMAGLINGAVLYAKWAPDSDEARRARKIAIIVADYLMDISAPKDAPLAYFPPTYHGYPSYFKSGHHMQYDHTMMVYPAGTGISYLNLYDLTEDKKYLTAAKRIARTYVKRQHKNGTWYLFINNKTGKPLAENLIIPTRIIRFLTRLKKDYQMKGLKKPIQKAVNWIMDNPVKTFNWQAQFEDVGPTPPYKDLAKLQACRFAIHLYKQNKHLQLAEELTRYVEDQFVVWEKPMPKWVGSGLLNPKNWMIPSVMEQQGYWVPISGSVTNVIRLYWHAYMATHKSIYLAKAKSLANTMTQVQQIFDGQYPTGMYNFKWSGMEPWLSGIVKDIQLMYNFGKYLKSHNTKLK